MEVTRVWQKWRFCAPKMHLWLIKVWFSASIPIAIGILKIANFVNSENVACNPIEYRILIKMKLDKDYAIKKNKNRTL